MSDKGLLAADLAREEVVHVGSNRAFGLTIGAVLGVIAVVSFLLGGAYATWWLAGAALFAVAGLTVPGSLGPLNRLWFRFGMLLHRMISPVILAMMFYAVITPIGLLMRVLGKRPLSLGFDPSAQSYWIKRDPPGPKRDSLPDQF